MMDRTMRAAAVAISLLLACAVEAAVPTIPQEAKLASEAGAYRQQIAAFINDRVARIADAPDPDKAREDLYNEIPIGAAAASAAYRDLYCELLGAAVLPLKDHASTRVRLNAAMVVARIAEKTHEAHLAGAAAAFVDDRSWAVSLWGIRAAGRILPDVLANPATRNGIGQQLIDAIVAAAKRHDSAPLAQEAYEALDLLATSSSGRRIDRQAFRGLQSLTINAMQDLFAWRIGKYVTAAADEPASELKPINFLCHQQVWTQQTPQQQIRTMQCFINLMSLSTQRIALEGLQGREKAQYTNIIHTVAGAISVIGEHLRSQALMDAVLSPPNQHTPLEKIEAWSEKAIAAICSEPQFKAIDRPPTARPVSKPEVPATEPAAVQ